MNIKLISLLFLSSFIAASACAGIKETSPSSPQFDKSQIVLEDYAHFEKFRSAMEAAFPIGTPKDAIDGILVKNNGAEMHDDGEYKSPYIKMLNGERAVRYYKDHTRTIECKFIVIAIYNKSDVLTRKIDAYYGCTGP